jgi:XTP/dITP diphosphohydrolase
VKPIIIATANMGKFREIREDLSGIFDVFYSLDDLTDKVEVEEDRASYAENAWKKARKIGDRFGVSTLADDSGLEVEALDGRPGLYSARYGKSDEERIDRLLAELEGVPIERRRAMFKAYLSFYTPGDEKTYFFYGCLKGYIDFERRGDKGFGFDPVFCLPDRNKSLAQIPLAEKNRISHRGRALATFRRFMTIGQLPHPWP